MSRASPAVVSLALPLLAALGAASAARAGDESETPHLEAKLENGESGATFMLRGRSTPLPDGTRLEVTLAAKGRTKDVVCALFRVVTQGNTYAGRQDWRGRTLAPMVYEAQVQLVVEKQSDSVRSWLMREYGYAPRHTEVLDSREVTLGSVEEQAAFSRENLQHLLGYADDLEALRVNALEAVETPRAENEEWPAQLRTLNKQVLKLRKEFDAYTRSYVVLLERGFLDQLLNSLKVIGGALYAHHQGRDTAHADLLALSDRIALVRGQIVDRLPIENEPPLVHPDRLEEEGEEEGER